MTTRTEEATTKVSLTIDGRAVEADPGELIIDAAERAGIFIPRFCYHPRMAPVGMCRMCLVEVSGPRGFTLQPACYFAVTEGQEIRTESDKARKAQEGVLEFLLVNHPLDCPVCDKGGECPLQDQALSHGPGESRFVEEKRHWAKPIEIGPLVLLDRERCIQCARCTRFAEEVAGEAMINLAFRADAVEVATFPNSPFTSRFAGNTIQICPVGALTSPAYRFASRPWDLEQVETTCTTCAVGCRIVAQSSAGRLVRHLGVDSDPVNQSWLCDKGRYGFEGVHAPSRLSEPALLKGDALGSVSWHEALSDVALNISKSIERGGPESVAFVGGARMSNEDAYAFSKLAKSVIGTDSVDAQLGDGLPAEAVVGLPHATIDEAASARVVVTLCGDLFEELPVLFLRLRLAGLAGTPIIECAPGETALSPVASAHLAYLPGESAAIADALVGGAAPALTESTALARARELIGAAPDGDGIVVVLGRPNLAESPSVIGAAATILRAAWPKARFLPAVRRANTHGALDMGLSPGLLPGRVGLDAGRAWFEEGWGSVPAASGRDTRSILSAIVDGDVTTLVLLGADPLSDFPDRSLARAAVEQCRHLVFIGTHLNATSALAHAVLPVAGDGERWGTTTNCEGRVTRLAAKVVPPGVAWPAWSVAAELANHLGGSLGFDGAEEISAEIARLAPAYRGVDAETVGSPARRDGVVVPLEAAAVAITARRQRPIDPIATPGILSTEEQGAPLSVGLGLALGSSPEGANGHRPPQRLTPPPLIDFAPIGPETPVPPPPGTHRLLIRRALYDRGSLVEASPSFAPLIARNAAYMAAASLASLGVGPGDEVRIASASGSLVLPVEVDGALAAGVVAITANLSAPGTPGAGALVDSAEPAIDVVVEKA